MEEKSGRIVVMWGHLLLLAFIAGSILYYWLDARAVSLRPNNLILVQPTAILALLLVLAVVPQCFPRLSEEEIERGTEPLSHFARIGALIASFTAFALSLETIGFDVATWLFMIVGLYICGERRWWLNLIFSTVFTVLLIYGYGAIIPFPFPLSIL
ncbi:tripartite tricarboxylate transporter TctB family protein [Alkalilacustris brevis]|uniref:tripartite tricarboxylate transporter TctB family protein n=1 Tax=Alkalilacustris brevis TaxID=2026338 RepID=UPI000E0DD7EB|nr:tripartite tricarboxylate transporter TctB family protein [Alkalilacustris brevis]